MQIKDYITEEQKQEIIDTLGDVVGRFYILWLNDNFERIVYEWFKGEEFTIEDVKRDQHAIADKLGEEFVKWSEESL